MKTIPNQKCWYFLNVYFFCKTGIIFFRACRPVSSIKDRETDEIMKTDGNASAIFPHQSFDPNLKIGMIGAMPPKTESIQSKISAKTQKPAQTSPIPAYNIFEKCVFGLFGLFLHEF